MDINSDYDMVSVSNVYIDNADEDSEASSFTEFFTDTLNPPIQNSYTHFRTDLSKTLAHSVKGNNDTDTKKCYGTSSSDTIVIIDSDTDSAEEPSLPVPQRTRPTDEYSGPWLNAFKSKVNAQQKDLNKKVPKVTENKSNLTIDDCVISDDNVDSNDDQEHKVNTSLEADLGYCEGEDVDDNMCNNIHKTPTTTSSTPEFKATPGSRSVGRKSKRSQRFYCTDCRAVFSELHEHDRTAAEEQIHKEFTCDFCHEEFFSQHDYSKHGQSCARRCTCQFCGHVFDEITQLKQHLFTVHTISKEHASSIDIPTNASSKSQENLSTSSFSEYSTFSSDLNTSLSEPAEQEELVDSTKFPCNILCNKVFSNACNLKRHTTTKHPSQSKTVRRKKGRFRRNVNKGQNRYSDGQVKCNQVTPKGKSANSTVTVSRQQKTFTCDFCQKQFILEDEYSLHCKNCTVRCTCPFCGTTFQAMNELRRHMFTQHDLSDEESESTEVSARAASKSSQFPCTNCSKSFSTASNLQRHTRSQHLKSTKKQGTASKVKTKKYFPRSSGKHTGKQLAKTKTSEVQRRSASSSLKKSKEALPSQKKHMCNECGLSLSNIYNLRRHKTIHARKKAESKKDKAKTLLPEKLGDKKKTGKFCCGICGDHFNHLFNLERHAMKHSESTPYQCQICFTRFSQLQHLQGHFEKFHIMDS